MSFGRQTMTRQGEVEYPARVDIEWVAVDRKGRLAVFTTGGAGPIARAYLRVEAAFDRVSAAVRAMPESTDYELVMEVPRPDDFIAFARRGFFSYDWTDVHRITGPKTGRYEMQARPRVPARMTPTAWPPDLRGLLSTLASSELDFDKPTLDVFTALECVAQPALAADGAARRR